MEEGINPDNNDNIIFQPEITNWYGSESIGYSNENHDESANDFIVENRTQPTSQLSSPSVLGFNYFTSGFDGNDKCEDDDRKITKERLSQQQIQPIEHQYKYYDFIVIDFRLSPPEKGRARKQIIKPVCSQNKGRKKRTRAERINSIVSDEFEDESCYSYSDEICKTNNSIDIPLLQEYKNTFERKDENNSLSFDDIKYVEITDDEEDNYNGKEREQNIRVTRSNKKRRIANNNYDGSNQIPPPDPSVSLPQHQQQNQFLLQQLQQLQQMNRYGDIATEISDGYNLSNPPVVNCNNEISSQQYSSPQLLPPQFILDDEPNVQNYPLVELFPIIEHHEHCTQSPPPLPNLQQQPLTIPDYNNGIETPPLLSSPTLSPLNSDDNGFPFSIGNYVNECELPNHKNEEFILPEMDGTMNNVRANADAIDNVNVDKRSLENETETAIDNKARNELTIVDYARKTNDNIVKLNSQEQLLTIPIINNQYQTRVNIVNDNEAVNTKRQSKNGRGRSRKSENSKQNKIKSSSNNDGINPYQYQYPYRNIVPSNIIQQSPQQQYQQYNPQPNQYQQQQGIMNERELAKEIEEIKQKEREERQDLVKKAKKAREEIKTTNIELIVAIDEYIDSIDEESDNYRCKCEYCPEKVKEGCICIYQGKKICKVCVIIKIRHGVINSIRVLTKYNEKKSPAGEYSRRCDRRAHYDEISNFIKYEAENNRFVIQKTCCYCCLKQQYYYLITNRQKDLNYNL